MVFSSQTYFAFLGVVLVLHGLLPTVRLRNLLLVVASFLFYGHLHVWFCGLLGAMILANYAGGLAMETFPARRRLVLNLCLAVNLGTLGVFKYLSFFVDSISGVLGAVGLRPSGPTLAVLLPVGISFYTFQITGYIIDVHRQTIRPCRNLVNFALFASFFPQIVSGPIGRARSLIPQIESLRRWNWASVPPAAALMLRGLLKKTVIADNLSIYVDKIFMLRHPSILLLAAGTVAFAVQLFADFSGYTDMARASARLFGIELLENFDAPYLAVSPADFWRRWHISLSTWLRDYLFLPLSTALSRHLPSDRVLGIRAVSVAYIGGTLVTMSLAGLWHGAAMHYILWGTYYGVLMCLYHLAGFKGSWSPRGWRAVAGTAVMLMLALFSWTLFRAPTTSWLWAALAHPVWGLNGNNLAVGCMVLATTALFLAPLLVLFLLDRRWPANRIAYAAFYGLCVVAVAVLHHGTTQDFVYFRF